MQRRAVVDIRKSIYSSFAPYLSHDILLPSQLDDNAIAGLQKQMIGWQVQLGADFEVVMRARSRKDDRGSRG